MDINMIINQIGPIDQEAGEQAQTRFDDLIKPVGSLAKLEAMVAHYAGIIGSAAKKDVQYPKKALLLWSTDAPAIAEAMHQEQPVTLLAREAKAETYPLLIIGTDLEETLAEGALLTKEYLDNQKLQMLAFGALGTYAVDSRTEKLLLLDDGLEFLQALNDSAITAMAGGILQVAASKCPVMLDGVATCLAAIAAGKLAPLALEYCLAGHVSAEPGMEKLLAHLKLSAPLRLDIQSGDGTGAVLAFTLFDAGIKAYNEMETFAEAGVHAEMQEFSQAAQIKGK